MHRNVIIREYSLEFDPLLPDQESLLIQLCEHLFRSGFVFHDSTETEMEAGRSVLDDFFDQEAELLRELVPRKRFNSFNDYLNNFGWSSELLQKKLRLRILKAFDQLAKGKHHHFNIRYNITQALRKPENHTLYDLLLYIEMYYNLILAKQKTKVEDALEETDSPKTNFKLEDLVQLRSQLQERLEGRELVKGFLKHIAKARGVSPESLVPREKKQEHSYPPIIFIRPSKQSTSAVKEVKFRGLKTTSASTVPEEAKRLKEATCTINRDDVSPPWERQEQEPTRYVQALAAGECGPLDEDDLGDSFSFGKFIHAGHVLAHRLGGLFGRGKNVGEGDDETANFFPQNSAMNQDQTGVWYDLETCISVCVKTVQGMN